MKKTEEEIKKIAGVYKQYSHKLDQIDQFIYVSIAQKDFVEVAGEKITGIDDLIDKYVNDLKELSNSVVVYNAVIISIYGSFELYIDEMLKAYIDYMKMRQFTFNDLPCKLQEKQKSKAAEFINHPGRFINYGLSVEQVISNLKGTIIDNELSEVTEELLISHGGNLRTGQIEDLFNEFGFENLLAKIKEHRNFKQFSKECGIEGGIVNSDKFPLLDTIVEERNKVAHGWTVENRLSLSVLLSNYIPFFRVFCEAINDLMVSKVIEDSMHRGELLPFDSIINVWFLDDTIVGINSKEFTLHVGDILYYSTPDGWNYSFQINSLMNKKKRRNYIRAKNKDITIGCNVKIKKNYTIWGAKELCSQTHN